MDIQYIRQMEDRFYNKIDEAMNEIQNLEYIDMVVGIPFYNEKESLRYVIKTAEEGLKAFPDMKKLIVCAGDPAGKEAMEAINGIDCEVPCLFFLMEPGINGRGFSMRAIMEIAKRLEADAVFLEADLKREGEWGFKPSWIERLIYPLTEGYDIIFTSFRRHYFEDTTGDLLARPILESLYSCQLKDPLSGIYAISHDLIEDYCSNVNQWYEYAGGYGVDPWMVTRAIVWDKKICEVSLGAKLTPPSAGKRVFVFKEVARAIFECLKNDQDYWLKSHMILKRPAVYGLEDRDRPKEVSCRLTDFIQAFESGYDRYRVVYEKIFPDEVKRLVEEIHSLSHKDFRFDENIWARVVCQFLQTYSFDAAISTEDILDAFTVLYEGRTAGYIKQVRQFRDYLVNLKGIDMDELTYKKVKDFYAGQVEALLALKPDFVKTWVEKTSEVQPVITPLDYLEFIPGVPIVLPKELKGLGGSIIRTNEIFRRVEKKYSKDFHDFIHNTLKIPEGSSPSEVCNGVKEFMLYLEDVMNRVFPGDLYSSDGITEVANGIFNLLPHGKVMMVKSEILRKLLYEFPPLNLMIRMDYKNVTELLNNMSPRYAITLANIMEERQYVDRVILWLEDNLRPDSMEEVDIEPIILNKDIIPDISDMRDITMLNKITGMITVSNLSKGMGGEYPKLRYFTHIVKNIVEAEHYSYIWTLYARERRGFGLKVANSILGHHGRDVFSAHNMFENWHQREMVIRFKKLAEGLESKGAKEEEKAFYLMAEGYGLSLIMNDGTFVPCSAWTWASYSFRGGKGIPTPLSLHVERDWFDYDLLEEIYKEMGYRPEEILDEVFQLIGEGKESIDLIDAILGIKPHTEAVMVQDVENWPQAGSLTRYEKNPILKPLPDHWWECRYVLNAATLRIKDRVYLLYRAFGRDSISRIGLVISDGYNIVERLPEPVFYPENNTEKDGCEDPRVVIIDDRIYMMYTAYDGVVAQVAAASISVEDFLNRDFDRWERLGLAFPNLWDKDAILFPEKINGKYVIYHRIEPSIWVSYSDELKFPWPKDGHKIIIGPRSGMMWDSLKIGAGTQPLKTRYGWLLIYHGVDDNLIYRLGVILVDLKDPGRLLYRSPNPILSPEMEYETGDRSTSWVPNVVFTCGAVPAEDKDILDAGDEILVYYGSADTYICVAHAKVDELIPEEVRKRIERETVGTFAAGQLYSRGDSHGSG
ncbi:MAG: glycosidase [Thermoanaerobacteraceae bacterium]|nr:glycosidase [Thermoanaerobacteraceae bacterium]